MGFPGSTVDTDVRRGGVDTEGGVESLIALGEDWTLKDSGPIDSGETYFKSSVGAHSEDSLPDT